MFVWWCRRSKSEVCGTMHGGWRNVASALVVSRMRESVPVAACSEIVFAEHDGCVDVTAVLGHGELCAVQDEECFFHRAADRRRGVDVRLRGGNAAPGA